MGTAKFYQHLILATWSLTQSTPHYSGGEKKVRLHGAERRAVQRCAAAHAPPAPCCPCCCSSGAAAAAVARLAWYLTQSCQPATAPACPSPEQVHPLHQLEPGSVAVLRELYKQLLRLRKDWLGVAAVRPGGARPAGRPACTCCARAAGGCDPLLTAACPQSFPGQASGAGLHNFFPSMDSMLPSFEVPLDPSDL